MKTHQAFISLGSNVGDKIENCRLGEKQLVASGRSRLIKASPYYRTSPVDYEDQAWFVNGVVKIETTLNPFDLLKEIKTIEKKVGREEQLIRFGPRILDMDILLFGDCIIRSNGLEVPHPRMHKRRFVLQPICDIDPSTFHPLLKKDMQFLLNSLDDSEQEVIKI